MKAGRLKQVVSIQARSGAADDYGQLVNDWVEKTTRRAAVEPLNGKEFFAAGGENTGVSVRVRFRYEAGLLDESMRLVVGDLTLDIESIINHALGNRDLVCMCRYASAN
ncbi:MAG: phage head closure protein [Candidatus Reddybacter sp.]